VQALAGLEFTLEMGVDRLRAHNLEQKKQLSDLLFENGVETTGVGDDFGAFLTVRDDRAPALVERLRKRGVTADARGDALRLCPDLLNTDEELERAAKIIGAAVNER
jgi:kynureninase